jgi:hypothetical protein
LKKDLAQRLAGGPRLYAEPGPVRPWIEAGYWRRLERHSGINSAEALWIDYAAAEEGKPFFSPGLLSCGDCNSALLALAVSDLPFEAPQPHIHEDLLTPASPLIFAQSALRVDDRPAQEFPVLVSYATVDGNERRPHQGSFARGIVYAAKVRVNNLSEEAAKLSLLMQIPAGALALGEATSLEALEIPAFSSAQREILFYFPEAGDFHGVHAEVSRAGKVIGYSEPPRLQALETAPPAPLDTWSRIAEAGSPEQILQWLRDKPLKGEDLSLCAHLMKERKHYLQVLEILRLRHRFDSVLWSYSLFHDDFPALGEFLASGPLAEAAAPFFSSEILKVDAMRSGDYRHRDFLPLIHPRSFGKKRLADEGLRKQYQELLEVLRYKPELNAEDHLELAYYLLLQDRFTEAAEELALAPRFKLSARIQRDALECYLLFAQEKPQEAAKIAAAYEHYAIPHWREHFAEVTRQAAEIASGATLAGDKDPAPLAPALSCELRAGVLRADTANLKELRIEAHPVDVETLFSRTPFQLLGSLGGGAPLTAPAAVFSASPDAQGKLSFALPEKWSQVPLLLQVSGGGRRETLSQLPHSFSTRLAASQGQLQVLDAAGKGLGKVYVKVYARRGGQAVFHKDGFTDLRGRFDYASLNTSLEGIDAFAILVLGGKEGAAVLEAKPPQR